MARKYINVAIPAATGHSNSCWVPMVVSVDLYNATVAIVSPGYLDKAANLAGKSSLEAKATSIPASALSTWDALTAEAILYMVNSTTSPLSGGTIEDLV